MSCQLNDIACTEENAIFGGKIANPQFKGRTLPLLTFGRSVGLSACIFANKGAAGRAALCPPGRSPPPPPPTRNRRPVRVRLSRPQECSFGGGRSGRGRYRRLSRRRGRLCKFPAPSAADNIGIFSPVSVYRFRKEARVGEAMTQADCKEIWPFFNLLACSKCSSDTPTDT